MTWHIRICLITTQAERHSVASHRPPHPRARRCVRVFLRARAGAGACDVPRGARGDRARDALPRPARRVGAAAGLQVVTPRGVRMASYSRAATRRGLDLRDASSCGAMPLHERCAAVSTCGTPVMSPRLRVVSLVPTRANERNERTNERTRRRRCVRVVMPRGGV